MYDPTVEISLKEQRDRYSELLSIGNTPAEASACLDTEYMNLETWLEVYGNEEVDYSNYIIPEFENQPTQEMTYERI